MPRYYKNIIYTKADREMVGTSIRIEQEKILQERLANDPDYYRNAFESHKAAFARMHKESVAKRNKI